MRATLLLWVGLCAATAGCSRWHYVERADGDAYSILDLHSHIDDVSAPTDLTILPSPESRLFDPTPVETPRLPDPVPRLHTYVIPPGIGQQPQPYEELPAPVPLRDSPARNSSTPRGEQQSRILLARLRVENEISEPDDQIDISPVTIPHSEWASIPPECRVRMFEFESVRLEYEKSHGTFPAPSDRDDSPRLSFDDILHLALLNSREYQAQKEQLYRVALRLSLEEYDYQLKFAPFGNRTGVRYETRGSSLESLSRLDTPSRVQVEALLGTGTALVTRFANNVLLTFNGPDGFAADVSSELLFELTHSVFQNDIRFERLTQAERNVIYAARSFSRFRRTFYLQLAVQYYNLLRTNRQVEIDAQNYLSLARVYSQREVEFGQGQVARVQIDQVEQNALAARSSLIGTCNNLENALDQLKVQMGLPTETPINLDLVELASMTLSDEVLVKLELVRRAEQRLAAEMSRENQEQVGTLNHASQLVARMREVVELRQQSRATPTIPSPPAEMDGAESLPNPEAQRRTQDDLHTLALLQSWLQVSELRALSEHVWTRLQEARGDREALAIRVPEISLEFARSVESLLAEEQNLATALGVQPDQFARIAQGVSFISAEVTAFEALAGEVLDQVQLQRLDELRRRADALAATASETARQARATNVARTRELGLNFDESVPATLLRLVDQSRRLLTNSEDRLRPIDLDMDAASLSALVRRLDLANARGELFDQWRGTKLAADDLKSILDLQARQRLVTQNQTSQPFELDFDESRTEVSVTIDTPLNRRLQRNRFREQLLNYQLSRRRVMALEDAIKQDIRSELRSIRLSREQHALGIASAALAYERVISTELQLRLGVAGVFARDYLEAQTAYANSLSTVATRHISYLLGRITLFTDLEQLQLDPYGRWPALNDPSWNPELGLDEHQWPSYGELPWGIHYSKALTERKQEFWSVDNVSSPIDLDGDPSE